MKTRLLILTVLASACQSSSGNPLSLANDYLVAGGPGEQSFAITTGDGPNGSHLIFLNFAGASIVPAPDGYTDDAATNQSWLASTNRTIPAFDASPYSPEYTQASAIAYIENQYKTYYAAYNVSISTTRPTSGRYTMVMIGGEPTDLNGGSTSTSEAGVAPLDCGNMQESNIAYSFAASLSPGSTGFSIPDAIKQVADDAAHESGHSFGLEHTQNMADIMYPTLNDSITGFGGSAKLSDGSSSCTKGATTQNTAALLLSNLGAASTMPVTTPPTVEFTSPANGAHVALTFEVQITASAATGSTIAHVDVAVSGQSQSLTAAPYQLSITVPQSGAYTVTATAYDSGGNTAVATLMVTASSGLTPGPIPSSTPAPSSSPGPTTGKSVGAACSDKSECSTNICEKDVCSTTCDPSNANSCPSPLMCASTSAGDLCVPKAEGAHGGCSAVHGESNPLQVIFGLALLLSLFVRRRSRSPLA